MTRKNETIVLHVCQCSCIKSHRILVSTDIKVFPTGTSFVCKACPGRIFDRTLSTVSHVRNSSYKFVAYLCISKSCLYSIVGQLEVSAPIAEHLDAFTCLWFILRYIPVPHELNNTIVVCPVFNRSNILVVNPVCSHVYVVKAVDGRIFACPLVYLIGTSMIPSNICHHTGNRFGIYIFQEEVVEFLSLNSCCHHWSLVQSHSLERNVDVFVVCLALSVSNESRRYSNAHVLFTFRAVDDNRQHAILTIDKSLGKSTTCYSNLLSLV